MKKLFISCPMRGRTDEDIKKSMKQLHEIAEIYAGEKLEVIDTFLEGADYKGNPLLCLGESIKRMQEADYFIGVRESWEWHGCWAENEIFVRYKGRRNMILVDGEALMPDAYEAMRKEYEAQTPVCATATVRG